MGRRIGIFGGTFDPPHVGHLVAARSAQHQLGLDEVLLMVAGDPWQKSRPDLTDATTRLALVTAAVAGHDHLVASDLEVRRPGPTYTIDTLEQLAMVGDPSDPTQWVLVLGSDSASRLDTWHRAGDVVASAAIAVVERAGAFVSEIPLASYVERVAMPALDISSSDLRARCRDGRPIDFLVPDAVRSEIRRLGLYRQGS